MPDYLWVVSDSARTELSRSETFPSKEAAESWMAAHWSDLRKQGGEEVTLMAGDEKVYDMPLSEA